MRPIRRAGPGASIALALGAAACAHSEPFDPGAPDPLGPVNDVMPRRLTFNGGDDRSPAWAGADVIYSRYDPSRGTTAQCLAAVPAEGGTLRAAWCPPGPTPADTFVSTWLEPALADDGTAIAFVWVRGAATSALGAWSHHLAVAAADSAVTPRVAILLADALPGGARYNTAFELSWAGLDRVRFLAALDSIFKVKGGGAQRFTDTVLVPRGLFELELATGAVRGVPGGDGVVAYTPGPDGTLWVVRADTLWALDAGGGATALLATGAGVTDVAVADGRVVLARGHTLLEWRDPSSGAAGLVDLPGPVRRIAGGGGRRLVAEVEADDRPFGAPANLWLVEIPPATALAAGAR